MIPSLNGIDCEKEWALDMELKSDLQKYVQQNHKRSEILDFIKREFGNP